MVSRPRHVRYSPQSGHSSARFARPLSANSGLHHRGAQWQGGLTWERLEAPLVGNVQEQAAGLAMNSVGVVALKPAVGTRIANLVGSHERL
jgi:hypothetical protein